MLKVEAITKDWKQAGSFPAQVNLYGFWDEHSFLTKSGDLGAVLKIGGIDYESLDHAGPAAICGRGSVDPGQKEEELLIENDIGARCQAVATVA
jgi:hypothetical protein